MSTGRARGPIIVDGVWKRFRKGESHDSLRDFIPALVRSALRNGSRDARDFWALRDVSFRVEPGEVLGIVGPNGSGKSTLLKLLSGIMEPTHGRVQTLGRVGALIELAAGFHGELTGRKNVYLQGAVMGIKRAEIEKRFDEIVAFSEIGDFIDTPVKRYSSGMNARLGFSIAAHMDPDVLIIDEVLSVGDHAFQRKAEARLREIVSRDIPVIVVSHRLESVLAICDRAMLLSRGEVSYVGEPTEVVQRYVDGAHLAEGPSGAGPVEWGDGGLTFDGPFRSGDKATFRVTGTVASGGLPDGTVLGFRVWQLPGEHIIFATHHELCGVDAPAAGPFEVEFDFRANLGKGLYRIQPCVWDLEPYREWSRGPSALFTVDDPGPVLGLVGLDPALRRVR